MRTQSNSQNLRESAGVSLGPGCFKTWAMLAMVFLLCARVEAFPPAPHHEIYGTVRDETGNPLAAASVSLLGSAGTILLNTPVDQSIAPGVNYSLKIPMDAGTQSQLYQSSALLPTMPFTVKVTIGETDYVPMEVLGGSFQIGDPGKKTRLDLTLGVDSDGDGLPDAWENQIVNALDSVSSLEDVTRDGDSDGDGVSNYVEYLAGTYAFDRRASFDLKIMEINEGMARLRFLAVKGRSYTIKSSSDLEDFEAVPFSLNETGDDEQLGIRAEAIRYQDIYISTELISKKIFRLHVQ
jgi:hypothetical protein